MEPFRCTVPVHYYAVEEEQQATCTKRGFARNKSGRHSQFETTSVRGEIGQVDSEIILSVDNKGSKAFKNLLNRPNKCSNS